MRVWGASAVRGVPTKIGDGPLSYAPGVTHSIATYLSVMATATVNSVCHKIGYRRFRDTEDSSTNHLLMTVLTFGEGLHNNHHRFPRDAYLSHAWYEFDLNGLIILGLERLGLVTDVVHASKAYIERMEGSKLT